MSSRLIVLGVLLMGGLAGCAGEDGQAGDGSSEDEARRAPPVVQLKLDARGKCTMTGDTPRVKVRNTVRLKNVGDKPIAALIQLWDNFGGMPAPEGGDIEPGQTISVKMGTKWWILNDDPDSREWSTEIVCRRGPWSDDTVDFDEVGRVEVYR